VLVAADISAPHMPAMEQEPAGSPVIFAAGYLAGIVGDARESNPHMANSRAASVWSAGWDAGDAKRAQNRANPGE
jgi:ribosome modulation factor